MNYNSYINCFLCQIIFINLALNFIFVCGYQEGSENSLGDANKKQVPVGIKKLPNGVPFYVNRRHQGGRMYFAIAASTAGQTYGRAFNKTLSNITQSYLSNKFDTSLHNITLDTLVIELPENGSFSANLLENLCEQFEKKHVAALLVIGDSPAAFSVTMAANHAGVPVLWARGHTRFLSGFQTWVSFIKYNR